MKIVLGKHIISQPSRRNSDVESNGEETSIWMQPFSGCGVIYNVGKACKAGRLVR